MGGEGGCNGGPVPCMSLTNGTLFLWWPSLLPQNFPVVELLSPVTSGCLFTANSCPLPWSTLQLPLSSTQLPSATGDTHLRLGCTGLWHIPCVQILLFLSYHRPVAASNPLNLVLCPCFPLCEGASLSVGTSSHLQFPAKGAGPFPFPLFFFSFFHSTLLRGNFS